ncbi:type II secretion system inner membrane protein GspF [endosymbiont of Ridgeia piscesae]|uniref:General secretion pathway protein F n=1 Tax=endosymbiont of Ridgeia piscesae TaxID=54398 RepID=A0A0T5Z7W9_9GAMM|nr:type II secretion system inner membrane protein GspF [endosymbiont of Ridgeia piscesae]KRT55773.1 type II secretion system protein F [endosymbiont of Ridgeia piscesae]KRT58996.1 general secretion pathway protein F [endosymbiont of Ridgeia piscesae]
MDAFEFIALDGSGKEKRGMLEGDSPRQIRQQLRESGLTPLSVSTASASASATQSRRFTLQRGISPMELALLTRQMATLLRAALPVEQVLKTVSKQSEKRHISHILLAVRAKVLEGRSLADGLSEFPRIFPELYIRTVASGEESGHLDLVLERLADYTEMRQQMHQKTVLALFYPALLTIVAVLIVAGLLTYIVPQVTRMFDNMAQELPLITKLLIATSDVFRDHGLTILVLLLLLGLAVNITLKRPAARLAWHKIILHIPLLGRLTRSANAARFSRTLSIMAASSVPILDALRIASQVVTNLPMRAAVEEASLRVREGSSLHAALEKTGYFPPLTLSLLASGESSGNLEGMLERSANIQEKEIESLISTLLGLFEPILILVMGAIVTVIVMGILLPIFDLNQLVG